MVLLTAVVSATPHVVQTQTVRFPKNGMVVVQAREEVAQNPSLVVRAKSSGNTLLTHTFTAEDDLLKPNDGNGPIMNPFLRFQVFSPTCFGSPLILATAVAPGGSDHGFWAAVIGEVEGQIKVLTPANILLHVQSGIYFGPLNAKLGCGLVAWNFVWNNGAHYDRHPYEFEIYKWQGNRLLPQPKFQSKRQYMSGLAAVREAGIRATDFRLRIPKVKKYLE